MALTLYYLSGSPYAWRVWLALEHKGFPYQLRTMSYDAGDFQKPEFAALDPRRRVPVIDDGGFVLYESAAIVEYLDENRRTEPDCSRRTCASGRSSGAWCGKPISTSQRALSISLKPSSLPRPSAVRRRT